MFQVPVQVHEVADVVGVVVSGPILLTLLRVVYLMGQIKAELVKTVEGLVAQASDHEKRIRLMEPHVEILWDGRMRRKTDQPHTGD